MLEDTLLTDLFETCAALTDATGTIKRIVTAEGTPALQDAFAAYLRAFDEARHAEECSQNVFFSELERLRRVETALSDAHGAGKQ